MAKQPQHRPGAPGSKRAQNREKRLMAFRASSLELFGEHGLEGVTVEAITQHVGVAKGSFYRYFDDKRDLIEWLFAPIKERLKQIFAACTRSLEETKTHEEMMACYQSLAMELQVELFGELGLVWLYLQESRASDRGSRRPIHALRRQLTTDIMTLTEVAHQRGFWRPIPASVSTLAAIGAVETTLFHYLKGDIEVDPSDFGGHLVDLILRGLQHRDPEP